LRKLEILSMRKLELAAHGQGQDAYAPKEASLKEKKIQNIVASRLLAKRKEKTLMPAAKTSELILTAIVIMLATLKVLATRSWPNLSPTRTYGSTTTPKLGKSPLPTVMKASTTSMTQSLTQIQLSSTALPTPKRELAKEIDTANGRS
jgi:multisubunit Na+/H+ antiporter MnhC subunit